jgi:hypothetical protein
MGQKLKFCLMEINLGIGNEFEADEFVLLNASS